MSNREIYEVIGVRYEDAGKMPACRVFFGVSGETANLLLTR